MIPIDSGTPPPYFRQFSPNGFSWISVRNRSFNQSGEESWETDSIQDSLERSPTTQRHLCIFFAFRHRNRKVDGGHWGVPKPGNPDFSTFRIWPGHPPTPRNFCRALSDRRWREERWELRDWEVEMLSCWVINYWLLASESARNSDLEGDPSRYGEKFFWGEPYSIV